MRKLLLILGISFTVFSCGSLKIGYDTIIQSKDFCYTWKKEGEKGKGYYDCDGNFLGKKVYDPYKQPTTTYYYGGYNNYPGGFYNPWFSPQWGFGPRIIVYPASGGNSGTKVATPRGGRSTTPVRPKTTPRPKVQPRVPRVPTGGGKKVQYTLPNEAPNGAALFFKYCAVCHMNGIGGAPHPTKMNLNMDTALNGKGAMPSMKHLGQDKLDAIFNYIEKLQK